MGASRNKRKMPSGRENDKLTFSEECFNDMLKEYCLMYVAREENGKTVHSLYQEVKSSEDVHDLHEWLLWEFDLK